jgi:hypothetical protein
VPDKVEDEPSPGDKPQATKPTKPSKPSKASKAAEKAAAKVAAKEITKIDKPAKAAEPIPRFVEFRPGGALSYLFGTLFTIFAVGAVIAIFWAVSAGGSTAIFGAIALTLLAMGAWWALLNWTPAIVSISNGTLEISRGSDAVSWDLRDPKAEIVMTGKSDSRTWKAVLRDKSGKSHTITPATVDPEQFIAILDHYRSEG